MLVKGTLRVGFTTKLRDKGKKKTPVGFFLCIAIASTSSSNAMHTTLQNVYTSEAHFVATGYVQSAIICTVTVRISALKVANEFQDRWLMHASSLGRTGSTCFGIWFHISTKETRTRIAFLTQMYFLVFIILQVQFPIKLSTGISNSTNAINNCINKAPFVSFQGVTMLCDPPVRSTTPKNRVGWQHCNTSAHNRWLTKSTHRDQEATAGFYNCRRALLQHWYTYWVSNGQLEVFHVLE